MSSRLEVEKRYKEICLLDPDMIKCLQDSIDTYVESRETFRSDQAGSTILPEHEQFVHACGGFAAGIFGMVMIDHLKLKGWSVSRNKVNGKLVTWYSR